MRIDKIRKQLKDVLKHKRYEHTLGVEFTSAALAMRYDADIEKARLAGLLHDCARYMDDEEILKYCEKKGLPVSKVEKGNPVRLLHAKAGAQVAKDTYDCDDEEILDAIRYHTTGRPNMSLLEKICFTADYIEPGRQEAPRLDLIRKESFIDLDKAILYILEDTIGFLENESFEIEPTTRETYEFYKEK